MIFIKYNKTKRLVILLSLIIIILLSGCKDIVVLMDPKGIIGIEERSLIMVAIGLMSIVVIPVIIMTLIFSFKYRSSNIKATYKPDWDKSNKIEIIVWSIPIIIIICLSVITWKSTHNLDPARSIQANIEPINIEVIALDWKWLFIYPKQGIATLNEIAFPINIPVKFKVTSNSVMNSFFIPQLGSQIYAMAGMNNKLNLIANKSGKYDGISSNFSGRDFSKMKFTVIATNNQNDFNNWIKKVKMSPYKINNINSFDHLTNINKNHSIKYFSQVKQDLFQNVINKFID